MAEFEALPHSVEAERATLAAVMMEPSLLPLVAAQVQKGDFYLGRHQLIFAAIQSLAAEGTPIDLRTVQAQLETTQTLEAAGGLAHLVTLDEGLPDFSRAEAYATIVREKAMVRAAIEGSSRVMRAANEGGSLADLHARIVRLAQDLAGRNQDGLRPIGEVVEETLDRVTSTERGPAPLLTGFLELDRLTRGIRPGRLVIVAGRPGHGKTSLALNIANFLGVQCQIPGVFWSLEMGEDELALRILSARTDIPFERLERSPNDAGTLISGAQWTRLLAAVDDLHASPLVLSDSSHLTMDQVESVARARVARGELQYLIIDYLGLMTMPHNRSKREAYEETTRRLKNLAKELKIVIFVLSQLNREAAKRQDTRPQLADLRESGSIEQDADLVLFVHRPELYNPGDPSLAGKAEIQVGKHRHGPPGIVSTTYDGACARFLNAPPQTAPHVRQFDQGEDPF